MAATAALQKAAFPPFFLLIKKIIKKLKNANDSVNFVIGLSGMVPANFACVKSIEYTPALTRNVRIERIQTATSTPAIALPGILTLRESFNFKPNRAKAPAIASKTIPRMMAPFPEYGIHSPKYFSRMYLRV